MIFARRKRSGALASAVELTPLIDVLLLLLIFFTVSTTFLRQRALAVALPEVATASPAAVRLALVVEVDASGETLVDGRRLANAGALVDALAAEHEAGRPLLLAADRDARHHAVVRVLDAARRAGFVDVQLAARSPASQAHGR